MMTKYALGVLIALAASGAAMAQTAPTPGAPIHPRTIEELYLSQNIELQIIRSQALSNSGDVKMLALQNLRSMVEEGRITEDNPAAFTLLQYLSQQERGPNTRNFPMVRREAVNILADIRSDRSKRILMNVLLQDNEPMVLSEAAFALGQLGINETGEVTEALMWTLHRENNRATPDNNLAFAILLAVERLARTEGGLKRPEYLNALIGVLESNYIRDVKLKAIDVIYTLRRN